MAEFSEGIEDHIDLTQSSLAHSKLFSDIAAVMVRIDPEFAAQILPQEIETQTAAIVRRAEMLMTAEGFTPEQITVVARRMRNRILATQLNEGSSDVLRLAIDARLSVSAIIEELGSFNGNYEKAVLIMQTLMADKDLTASFMTRP